MSSDAHAPPSAPPLTGELLREIARDRARHLAFVRRRLGVRGDAEDVLQLALLRAARHVGTLRETERVEAWFWRILRNTLETESQRLYRESQVITFVDEAPAEPTPAEIATCACSLGVLGQLKPDYRSMLQRADLDDEPMRTIADDLGITVNNATVRLHRARRSMRDALLAHCGTGSTRACLDCGCDDAPSAC